MVNVKQIRRYATVISNERAEALIVGNTVVALVHQPSKHVYVVTLLGKDAQAARRKWIAPYVQTYMIDNVSQEHMDELVEGQLKVKVG